MEAKENSQAQSEDYSVTLELQVREIVSETLATSEAVEELPPLLGAIAQFLDRWPGDIDGSLTPHKSTRGAQGRACCWTSTEVHASALEVIGITVHLADHFSQPDLRALARNVRQAAEAKKAQYGQEKPSSFPCPLLKDNRCRIYPVRPFVCRRFNSYYPTARARRKPADGTT